jgi:hypothetical protein
MSVQVGASVLQVPASVSNGAAVDCRAMEAKTVQINGAFVATYQIQISCDPSATPAPASFTNFGSPISAAGNVFVQQPCAWIRIACTAYTSGTPTGAVAGMTSIF